MITSVPKFYTQTLGREKIRETYRKARQSWKLDLKLHGGEQLELFSFPHTPQRPSRPEACGLRHLAFRVRVLDGTMDRLTDKGVVIEPVRIDETAGCRFTFFSDPDGLPIALYEVL